MDGRQFDDLVLCISAALSRRHLLQAVAGSVGLVGLSSALSGEQSAARRRKRKKRKKNKGKSGAPPQIPPPCISQCAGKACGPDGCGGECVDSCAPDQTAWRAPACVPLAKMPVAANAGPTARRRMCATRFPARAAVPWESHVASGSWCRTDPSNCSGNPLVCAGGGAGAPCEFDAQCQPELSCQSNQMCG